MDDNQTVINQNVGQSNVGQTATNVTNQPLSIDETVDLQNPVAISPPPPRPPLTQSSATSVVPAAVPLATNQVAQVNKIPSQVPLSSSGSVVEKMSAEEIALLSTLGQKKSSGLQETQHPVASVPAVKEAVALVNNKPIEQQPTNNQPLQEHKLKPELQNITVNNQSPTGNPLIDPNPKDVHTEPIMTVSDAVPEDDDLAEIRELEEKVDQASEKMPPALQSECRRLIKRVYRMAQRGSYSSEFDSVAKYVDWVTRIPWGVYTEDNLDLDNIKERLERHHYGLKPVKKMILEYMSVMKLLRERGRSLVAEQPEGLDRMTKQEGSSGHAPIMCFVGLQGLGKTTIGKSIGDAINRKFVRVPMGAMGDIRQLRGTAKVLPDAEPGYITKALVKAGSMNPVILLDEVDKSSGQKNLWSDIMAALLEILDPQQNSTFIDHYLEYPLDLSQVFFITTANTLGTLSAALLDRLDIIRFTSYNDEEKVVIASKYLLNKVIKASGLTKEQLIIDKDVWLKIVRPMGFDAGIRQLERTLTGLARKVAYEISTTDVKSVLINDDNVKQYLPDNMGVMG